MLLPFNVTGNWWPCSRRTQIRNLRRIQQLKKIKAFHVDALAFTNGSNYTKTICRLQRLFLCLYAKFFECVSYIASNYKRYESLPFLKVCGTKYLYYTGYKTKHYNQIKNNRQNPWNLLQFPTNVHPPTSYKHKCHNSLPPRCSN